MARCSLYLEVDVVQVDNALRSDHPGSIFDIGHWVGAIAVMGFLRGQGAFLYDAFRGAVSIKATQSDAIRISEVIAFGRIEDGGVEHRDEDA